MTFLICILILLMQSLWMHVKDLVGKGVEWKVLAEFFLYAALNAVPLALPLAILLASLMTFGNMGESFELIAMKAAGISLFRIMRPFIFFISLISIGAFFFSNYAAPAVQTKMWALLFSLRQKSPELDIPVGEFYSGIEGRNIYVREKDGKVLKDLMIYDFSNGFNNASIMLADSGYVQLTADKKHLLLTLYSGESFENIKQQKSGNTAESSIPYRREVFTEKKMLIEFDSDLNRYDESILRDQHVSKNVYQLANSIDSTSTVLAGRLEQQSTDLFSQNPFRAAVVDSTYNMQVIQTGITNYDIDSLFQSLPQASREDAMLRTLNKAKEKQDQVKYNRLMVKDSLVYIVRHKIELHRKFTLSFACLIFFFIGAPLGAIIRKGGLGMPAIISVLMFIVYYIIDHAGYTMAREGVWPVYQGMWLSSAILLPVGIFLTYKAAIDATLFNSDQYKRIWETIKTKLLRKKKKSTSNL